METAMLARLWFAADGKGLLVEMTSMSGDHLLYRVELKLSAAEIDKVRRRLANVASLGCDLLADGKEIDVPWPSSVPRIRAFVRLLQPAAAKVQ